MVVEVSNKTKGSPWWLDLLHLQREGSTGKKDLNKAFVTEMPNSHIIVGGPLQDRNPGRFITPQQFMGWQERYAEEERQHAAHLHNVQLKRQADYDREALAHQAHLAELQRQKEHQREMEILQEQACLDELQCL
jgi:hypothetical protein